MEEVVERPELPCADGGPNSPRSPVAPLSDGRERPILFSAPMVRALLDGRKTQTRRIIKRTALEWLEEGFTPEFVAEPGNAAICPFGKPGDRLWVREAWSAEWSWRHEKPRDIIPAAPIWYWADGDPAERDWTRPKPSIHMPRWASRITLEVTEVRVERLQDISEADATAEGSKEPSLVPIIGACWSERDAYAKLWEHINGPGSWDANPWVWAVSFKVITPDQSVGRESDDAAPERTTGPGSAA